MSLRPLMLASVLSLLPIALRAGVVQPETLHGDVIIRSNGLHNIFVIVDTFSGTHGPDGVADHLFALGMEEPVTAPVFFSFEAAMVTIQSDSITVYSARDHAAVLLGFPEALDALDVQPNVQVTRFTGLGVNHHPSPHLPPMTRLKKHDTPYTLDGCFACYVNYDAYDPVDDDPYANGASCQSGGPDATACSMNCGTTGCSISCRATSYACCNCSTLQYPKCSCVRY